MNEFLNSIGGTIVPILNSDNGLSAIAIMAIAAIAVGNMYKETINNNRGLQPARVKELDKKNGEE